MTKIYLDHSATTPVDKLVAQVVNQFMVDKFGNPSSLHSFGREAKEAVENSRDQIAQLLNCDSEEIYFTSGGTESDNLALIGYSLRHRDSGDHVIISNVEHPAIRAAADELERLDFNVTRIQVDKFGEVHSEDIFDHLTDRTILVSIMHVNNEVGTVNDVGSIGQALKDCGICFHTDAVQSFGKVPIDVKEMCIDSLSISSHKIYGPKGVGAIFLKNGIEISPRFFGGRQQTGVRPGTENIPGIVGFGMAAQLCGEKMNSEANYLCSLREQIYSTLCAELEDITLNGHPEKRLPGNLNLTFHGVEGEALLVALDLAGIAASSGSACSSGSTQPSEVLINMGLTPEDVQSSLRLTLGRSNTPDDIAFAARTIIDTVKRLRSVSGMKTTRSL